MLFDFVKPDYGFEEFLGLELLVLDFVACFGIWNHLPDVGRVRVDLVAFELVVGALGRLSKEHLVVAVVETLE